MRLIQKAQLRKENIDFSKKKKKKNEKNTLNFKF